MSRAGQTDEGTGVLEALWISVRLSLKSPHDSPFSKT